MVAFNPGGTTNGGNYLGSFGGGGSLAGGGFNLWNSLKDFGTNFGGFLGGEGGQGLMDFGKLALNTYGMNKSLGMAEDQLGIMQAQEGRAATAQNFNTGNSLALQLQTTTPGTPEHARIKQAIAESTFSV
jgi:hypothetical protein